MIGTLYGVGIGPGDPELITFKAARIIQQCPILAVPRNGRFPAGCLEHCISGHCEYGTKRNFIVALR